MALFLAGAAQLITISALAGADPIPATWSSLLLACQQLAGLLDLQECRFEYGVLLGHPPRLEADGTVVTKHGRWNVDEAGLPGEASSCGCSAAASTTGGS